MNAQILTHRYAEVNGHSIHYVISGKGRPVLLLHGWPETWYAWRFIIPALAEEYTVIAPDLTGIGQSEAPSDGFDQRTVAEDMYQLMQQLGYKETLLVAHDWGAAVAYMYASSYPEAVSKLVILDVGIMDSSMENRPLLARSGKNLWWFPFHMVEELPELLIAGKEKTYLSWFYNNSTFNKIPFTEEVIDEYVRHYSAPGAMGRSLAYYRQVLKTIDYNEINARTKLTMPVLALGGDHGFGMYPYQSLQKVALDVQGGVIPDCGHYIAEEQPEMLINYLQSFFKA